MLAFISIFALPHVLYILLHILRNGIFCAWTMFPHSFLQQFKSHYIHRTLIFCYKKGKGPLMFLTRKTKNYFLLTKSWNKFKSALKLHQTFKRRWYNLKGMVNKSEISKMLLLQWLCLAIPRYEMFILTITTLNI